MSKLCIINTIKTKIKGNATSYVERENEIFIPKSDNFTLEQTYKIAVKKVDKINQEYLSEKFGKVVSLNTSASNGTGIKIHPSQLLIDAYEVKEGNKSIEELNPRNLDYFNGDEALFEQEQNDELKPFIEESKNIGEQIKDIDQQFQEEKIIKPGVSELFEFKRSFADYSDFGKTLSEQEIINLKKEGTKVTTKQFLESIIPVNDFEKKLKSFLLSIDLNKLNGFDFVINDKYQGNIIGLNERNLFEKPTVIFNSKSTTKPSRYKLHEFLHSLLDTVINEEQEFRTELITLFDYVKTLPEFKNEYGVIGWWEFYTEGMTNPDFQAKLKNVTLSGYKGGKKSNVYEEFVKIINNILEKLGFVNKDYSALDEIINATTKVIEKRYGYSVKSGVSELFESNPELANAVYEALGFKNKLKTALGKELEYKDPYVPQSRLKSFKQYEVLNESGDNIGTVVVEYRGNETVILHPKLNVTNKGYGKDLYKLISSKFNVEVQEWNEGAIANSDSAKKMWDSLEKEGSAKRIIDAEQGDNFRVLNYSNQLTSQQKQQAQQLYSQYLDTIKSNVILPTDRIVFGHPTIGKSFLKNQGEDKFISLDDDYATEINNKVKEIADKYNVTTYQVKDGGTQSWNNEYNQMMQEMFNVAKQRAISENKTLFTSNTNLLKNNVKSFDKVINLTDKEFQRRIQERGAKYDTKEWKSQINEAISKLPANKVINTDKYLSDLFLGSKQNIEGFKDFVQGKQFQKLTAEEKAKTIEQVTKEHRSIVALKDLSAKLAWRIGGKVEFENRTDVDWKAYNQGMTSVLNEAYMTPDTPFHEILAHPIIRAIKNQSDESTIGKLLKYKKQLEQLSPETNIWKIGNNTIANYLQIGYGDYWMNLPAKIAIKEINDRLSSAKTNSTLYQSLLKELETGRGKEVLDRIKRDYQYREGGQKQFEKQQEEAIVTLLGMMAADKLDAKKDATLISKLKELWKQISDFVKSLLLQDGIKIDELPITTTLNDLAEIMAYGNNKIILPGYKVEYSTPLGNKYDTLEEVNNEIRGLADANVEIDLSGVKINPNLAEEIAEKREILEKELKEIEDKITKVNKDLDKLVFSGEKMKSKFEFTNEYKEYLKQYKEFTDKNLTPLQNKEKEIYEKINDIRLEEGMFGSSGKTILNFIEKNKEYEQSKEIIEQWKKENNIQYDPEEVYSRGQGFYHAVGAYSAHELNLLLQNVLQHLKDHETVGAEYLVSFYTKPVDGVISHLEHKTGVVFEIFPQSEHIKWAAVTDVYSGSTLETHTKFEQVAHLKKEIAGLSETKYPAMHHVNDRDITPNLADAIDNLAHHHNEGAVQLTGTNFRIKINEDLYNQSSFIKDKDLYQIKKLIDNINKILDDKYGKLEKPEIKKPNISTFVVRDMNGKILYSTNSKQDAEFNLQKIESESDGFIYGLEIVEQPNGKQPTQTKGNTTSIESVKSNLGVFEQPNDLEIEPYGEGYSILFKGKLFKFDTYEKALEWINNKFPKNKKYTSQALINLKVAALKEVARRYPRSLITSKIVPINPNMVNNNEIQYSKVSSKQDIEGFKEFVSKKINNIKTDESINERLMKYEESIKIPNNVKSKVLEKIEKETEKVKEKLLSLGLKQDNNKFELITNSYATFKMKLKELENVNAIISTNKTSDFYQIIARLKNVDSTMELKKQGELPFTPIEVKQVIQEQQFLNDVADNVFEGLSEEEKQILKKKIENGDYDLNCRI